MTVGTSPLDLSKSHLGWPAGARIRFGTAKANWLRMRRGRRANLAVWVVTLIGRHEAVVTRITLFGAILRGGRRLKRREIIALRLPSGGRVKARVQWRFGSRCGITFMSPVADFARLLCEGTGVKSRSKHPRVSHSRAQFPIPTHEELALAVGASVSERLAGVAARVSAFAVRVRSWGAAMRDPRASRPE
jgi:hypothetical protein